MNSDERDQVRLRQILLTHHEGTELTEALDRFVTTVRQEERAAAFNDAAKTARETWVLVPAESENRPLEAERWKGFNQAAKEVAAKLETAANSVQKDSEGEGGDADDKG